MTVVRLAAVSRWTGDMRGEGRAVRATAHPETGVLTISVWRDDACSGTAQLLPADVAVLVARLTECLVELTSTVEARSGHDLGDGEASRSR